MTSQILNMPQRPDRRLLAIVLLTGAGLAVTLAVAPSSVVAGLLDALVPSSGDGGMREALVSRHRVVFGILGIVAAAVAVGLPHVLGAVSEAAEILEQPRTWVFLVSLISLVVISRLALSGRMLPIVPGEDSGHYFQLASTLLEEGRFIEYASHPNEPDGFRAWRLPGFPFALAAGIAVFGRGLSAVLAVNTVWTIVLVLSVYFLVRHLGSEVEARVAAILCAFYPALVQANLRAMSELQYASLTALGVCLLFGEGLKGRTWWILAGGSALGLAALTRGNGLLVWLGLLVVWPIYSHGLRGARKPSRIRSIPSALRGAGVLAAGFLITISPWMARNYLVLDEFVPLGTSGGANMWIGHHPGSSGLDEAGSRPPFPVNDDELAMSDHGFRKAVEYWLDEPVENLETGARIVVEILKVDSGALDIVERGEGRLDDSTKVALWVGFNLYYYMLWGLALFWGLAKLSGRWVPDNRPGLPLLVAVGYVLTYVPFIGWARYKIPALPFLIATASMVLVAMALPSERGTPDDPSTPADSPRTQP